MRLCTKCRFADIRSGVEPSVDALRCRRPIAISPVDGSLVTLDSPCKLQRSGSRLTAWLLGFCGPGGRHWQGRDGHRHGRRARRTERCPIGPRHVDASSVAAGRSWPNLP